MTIADKFFIYQIPLQCRLDWLFWLGVISGGGFIKLADAGVINARNFYHMLSRVK
jgi:hypothetical protein